jgi:hypothetical protein
MTDLSDVCIVIPSKRPPPLDTLTSFHAQFPDDVPVYVIVDPSLYAEHKRWYKQNAKHFPEVQIIKGKSGLVPQIRFCYDFARKEGYRYAFRLDDDCRPNFFVRRDRSNPPLKHVIGWARKCMRVCDVSLVGFANTSRVDWLGKGYGRSYALVHGGAQMFETIKSDKILPERIVCYEDIYRSCAHRARDGAVGRVGFVGMNKIDGMKDTVNRAGKAKWKKGMAQLLKDFPGFGTFHGEADEKGIPRFRHRRHAGFQSTPPEK